MSLASRQLIVLSGGRGGGGGRRGVWERLRVEDGLGFGV